METEQPKVGPELAPEPVVAASEKPADPPVVPETKPDDSKSLVVAEKTPVPEVKKAKSSLDRDIALAGLDKEKKLSFIKAWEESEKSKAENKAQKELSAITAWENTRKADIEAKLKQIEENFDKKKAEYGEKMKNKADLIHKQAEEKRALVVSQQGEARLTASETAAHYRATETAPKKGMGCFGG